MSCPFCGGTFNQPEAEHGATVQVLRRRCIDCGYVEGTEEGAIVRDGIEPTCGLCGYNHVSGTPCTFPR